MPCGLNGAVYFVEMDADGGKANARASGGVNNAGAKYGTGGLGLACRGSLACNKRGVKEAGDRVVQVCVLL